MGNIAGAIVCLALLGAGMYGLTHDAETAGRG